MKWQIISLFLFFTGTRATSVSSGHLDFMAGAAKKENILHLKDSHAEIKDFSEAFKDVASSEEKIKTTFRILNQPNDSRFKLDLALIISQIDIMDNESQSFENQEKAWAKLKPLLEKYDKNFTYPADYDVLSGDFIEIILDDWLDRYTQEKAIRKTPKTEGSESEVSKSLIDGSGSLSEFLRSSLEHDESESIILQEGSGSSETAYFIDDTAEFLSRKVEDDAVVEEEDSTATEGNMLHLTIDSSEGYELHSSSDESAGYDAHTTDGDADNTVVYEVHSSTEESSTDGYDVDTTEEESVTDVSGGYELHYTTGEEDETSSVSEGYEIAASDNTIESSTEYQLVGTTEDGEPVIQSTTEYFIPSVEERDVEDLLAEDSQEVSEGSTEFEHRSGYIVVDKKHPIQAGSIRGIPGVHFPDYDEIPITSFTCADKKYVPGFYADLETGCQVFHVCWPYRRESFLCPIGTVFNQALLSCDYWYSTNCSLSPVYYDANKHINEPSSTPSPSSTHKPHPKIKTTRQPFVTPAPSLADVDWLKVLSTLPMKSKVFVYPKSPKIDKPTHFVKTEQDKAVMKAMATDILGKILHAGATLKKAAVHTLPIKYATKKPGKPIVTKKPSIVHVTKKPNVVYSTTKQAKVVTKAPPKVIQKFVVKPKKLESLKPVFTGKFVSTPKAGKQQVMQKVNSVKKNILPGMLLEAMEMAGTVLQKEILPLTRMALVESSLKLSKSKKH